MHDVANSITQNWAERASIFGRCRREYAMSALHFSAWKAVPSARRGDSQCRCRLCFEFSGGALIHVGF
jgi:hypothetical protein